ncbi:hypothetical protein FJ958_08990 [Mesorhizobium sp. B2-3-5]|nr:hypothetical protein FJ958_08990 [Mesorhizobium sp. B2-3-5]
MWGRCPAGQRGALSRWRCRRSAVRPSENQFKSPRQAQCATACEASSNLYRVWRPTAPPSVLPDISPTSGEIGSFAAGASTIAVVAPVVTRRGVDAIATPPRLRSATAQAH